MSKLVMMLLGIGLMFGASFAFVFICWWIDDKRIDKEVKKKYPNWRK